MNETPGVIRRDIVGRVLRITIDNPTKKNAFHPQMMEELAAALTELEDNPDLWAGVICAEGPDFTAGLDMPKFFGPKATPHQIPDEHQDPFGLRKQGSKPIITAVKGICFTIGIEIMLAGDIVVAGRGTRFCQLESKRGIAPLGGAHFRYVTRAGWGNAMYHLMLCDEFGPDEAYRIGLVQEVVDTGAETDRAMEIAQLICQNAPLGVQAMKVAGRKFIEQGEQAAIDVIPEIREKVMSSEDMREGIASFVERRAAVFTGR
ncbi:MAG: crotonase/enoyl-CoA hydratase family protein [Marinibacterium sp.]|nr:crotonase/enoyl-CoA hydratase family protein [Marinibacterium sp.]